MQQVNQKRLSDLLQGVNEQGKQDKGITRLAYTKEEKDAVKWLIEHTRDLNITVEEDAVGNVFFHRKGLDETLPAIAMGSHIDTVVNGGMYDGVVGVISAIEVLYMLKDEEIKNPIDVIIFKAEESSRFGVSNIGSKLLTGTKPLPDLITSKKKASALLNAMVEVGYKPEDFEKAVKSPGSYKVFLEVHIEQGKILETEELPIGIVEKIAAPTRFIVNIEGCAEHSGSTPMDDRRDALVSAAKIILAVNEIGVEESNCGTVATVGNITVEPGAINVIPGKTSLWVDLRGVEEQSLNRSLKRIKAAIAEVCFDDEVKVGLEMLSQDKPVALAENVVNSLENICDKANIKYKVMNSSSGHDAMYMSSICPTGLIFIPCQEGISHNYKECAKIEDIALATELLAKAVLDFAK